MSYWNSVSEKNKKTNEKKNKFSLNNLLTNLKNGNSKISPRAVRVTVAVMLVLVLVLNIVFAIGTSLLGNINFLFGGQSDVTLSEEDKQELDSLLNVSGSDIETVPDEIVRSTKDIEVILLVGSDSRYGIGATARSDTMMLGVIDRVHKKIKLVSILRDCYVKIPRYGNNKINNAFFFDSVNGNNDLDLLRSTIANNLGIETDKFVIVDFNAFQALVDAIGGVTVEVTELEADYMCHHWLYGLFPRYEAGPGVYTMDGAEALNYARMRKVAGQNDFDRTERQRKLLSLIMQQATSMSYLEMAGVVEQILPYITTNYSQAEILGLAFDAVDILGYDIVQMTIPIDGSWLYGEVLIDNVPTSVISVNYQFNAEQLQKFIFDDDMTYANGAEAEGVALQYLAIPEETTTTTTAVTSAAVVQQTIAATTTTTTAKQTTTTTTQSTTTTTQAETTTTTATTQSETTTTTTATVEKVEPPV